MVQPEPLRSRWDHSRTRCDLSEGECGGIPATSLISYRVAPAVCIDAHRVNSAEEKVSLGPCTHLSRIGVRGQVADRNTWLDLKAIIGCMNTGTHYGGGEG